MTRIDRRPRSAPDRLSDLDPDEPEYDGIGVLAEFDGGVLRRFVGIHYFPGGC